MKIFKKILCTFLIVVMCLTSAPLSGFVDSTKFTAYGADMKKMFYQYVDSELEHNVAFPGEENQEEGVFSVLIDDFDNSGSQEMVTFSIINKNTTYIKLDLYIIENNSIVLTDSIESVSVAGGGNYAIEICGTYDDNAIKIYKDSWSSGGSSHGEMYQSYLVNNNKLVLEYNYECTEYPRVELYRYIESVQKIYYSNKDEFEKNLELSGFDINKHTHAGVDFDVNKDDIETAECFKGNHIFSLVNSNNMVITGVYGFINDNTKWKSMLGSTFEVGDIIQFGSYPQSKVTESAIITALNNKAPAWSNWTSYGYYSGTGDYGTMKQGDWMRYTDIVYNGDKYRGVKFIQCRPYYTYYPSMPQYSSQSSDYAADTVYWFKFESIDWLVIDPASGFVMCETIIDAQPYSNTIYFNGSESDWDYQCFNDSLYKNYASDYETSSIRQWLNNDFYNTAFKDSEKKEINITTLNNDGWFTSNGTTGHESLDSNPTKDKIFLLSYNEISNSHLGFNSNSGAYDKARFGQGSDYARSQGLYVDTLINNDYGNRSQWFLRSPSFNSGGCCSVSVEGHVYSFHYVEAIDGIRPALKCNLDEIIAADDTVPDSENSEEIKAYINEHVNFVNSNNYNNITTNASFYKQIWQYEEGSRNFTRYAAWDIIGDVGKFIALDFYGILKTDNPYDIILVDVFRDFVDREESSFASTVEIAGKATFTTLNVVNDFLAIFKTSGAWNTELEGATTAYLKKLNTEWLKGVVFTEETFDLKDYDESLYNGLQGVLSKISKSGNLKNSLNKGFGGLKNISTIADYISTGGDIVWKLFDAYQKYLIAQALCKTNAEILAAIEMISEFNMPNKASNLLKDALDPYWDVFTCDDFYASISKVLAEDGIWGSGTNAIYSLLVKDALKDIVYTALGKVCGFSFWTLSATYNLTYMCLDYLSGLGKQSEMHTLLNAAALFEKPLLSLVNSKAIELKNNKNLDSAVRFDALYVILQSLEGLCYKSMNTYISAFKQEYLLNYAIKTSIANNFFYSMIKGIQLNEDISACDSAIEVMVYLENEWRNMNCHNKKYTSSIINSVKCPTDIYVYDSNGNLALSIIDNKVTLCADEITAFVDGDEKIFVTPDTQKYTVKIKAIDNGVMNVSEARFKDMQYLGSESFKNVSITNNRTYTIDTKKNILERDDGVIIHQNGDIENCSCRCHKDGFIAKLIWRITIFLNKFLRKNKICSCGIYHY